MTQSAQLTATKTALGAIIESLTDGYHDALAAHPEKDRARALAAGEVTGIDLATGIFISGLVSARSGDLLDGLSTIRSALLAGLNPNTAREAVARVHQGIAAELQQGRPEFVRDLFSVSMLGIARWVEVMVNYPWTRLLGAESQVVVLEERPLAEVQELFVQPFLKDVPPEDAAQQEYVDTVVQTAKDPNVAPGDRAGALVQMAAIALGAGDIRAAVKLVAQATNVAPGDDITGAAATFLWVTVNAAARDRKFAAAGDYPDWLDVVAVLHGALRFEGRHPRGTPQEVAAFNKQLIEGPLGRQSL